MSRDCPGRPDGRVPVIGALLVRPARKPRTVCGVQSMASAICGSSRVLQEHCWPRTVIGHRFECQHQSGPSLPAGRLPHPTRTAHRNRWHAAGVVPGFLGGKMMRATVVALGLALLAVPASAQAPDIGRMLQGLTTGNQNQDQALREAYERGYRAGQQDFARQSNRSNRSRDDNRSFDRDSDNDQTYRRGPPQR